MVAVSGSQRRRDCDTERGVVCNSRVASGRFVAFDDYPPDGAVSRKTVRKYLQQGLSFFCINEPGFFGVVEPIFGVSHEHLRRNTGQTDRNTSGTNILSALDRGKVQSEPYFAI
jgi:hypothetical protein